MRHGLIRILLFVLLLLILVGLLIATLLPDTARSSSTVYRTAKRSALTAPGPFLPEELSENEFLMLVNEDYPLKTQPDIQLTELSNNQKVDKRIYKDLQHMMDDCRAAGNDPLICSSYRSWEEQEALYQNDLEQRGGRSDYLAVAAPGTSEHQLGLAVDIVSVGNQVLDSTQEETETQRWLMENSCHYGFILRYPQDKSQLTGIIYEPWHYRYVGKDTAQTIYAAGQCLEEYILADGG